MAHLAAILELVEEAKLDQSSSGSGASAQLLCLVAVCYNNVALEQLHLKDIDGATTSCQNARRLARLCLGYSNRWLGQFESTHRTVLRAMTTISSIMTVSGEKREFDMNVLVKCDIEA